MKDPPGDGVEAAVGSAATGVVGHPCLVIHNVSDSFMPVEHVELIGRKEHDYCYDAPPLKLTRIDGTDCCAYLSFVDSPQVRQADSGSLVMVLGR